MNGSWPYDLETGFDTKNYSVTRDGQMVALMVSLLVYGAILVLLPRVMRGKAGA